MDGNHTLRGVCWEHWRVARSRTLYGDPRHRAKREGLSRMMLHLSNPQSAPDSGLISQSPSQLDTEFWMALALRVPPQGPRSETAVASSRAIKARKIIGGFTR